MIDCVTQRQARFRQTPANARARKPRIDHDSDHSSGRLRSQAILA